MTVDTAVGTSDKPKGNLPARSAAAVPGFGTNANSTMASSAATAAPVGGGQPVAIMPPYLTINYIIALQGIYPSRN